MNVLIYDSKSCCHFQSQLFSLFQKLLSNYDVRRCSKFDLIENTKLIVIPGGRDKEFLAEIGEIGINNIKNFVEGGGRYLGICAGAYLACASIKFEINRPDYKVEGTRPLKFFPGLGVGSVTSGFTYNSEKGAEAKKIISNHEEMHVYANGGPYFDMNGIHTTDVKVTAKYEDGTAAIVDCTFGMGQAILSGIHLEVSANCIESLMHDHGSNLDDVAKMREILPLIEQSDTQRLNLLKRILETLGLDVNEKDTSISPIWVASLASLDHHLKNQIIGLHSKFPVKFQFYQSEALPHFNIPKYLDCISSSPELNFGKTLLYSERVTSTHTILESIPEVTTLLPSGSIFLATDQTTGRGRGGNHWISQKGCLQFTLVLNHSHIPSLIFLQYLFGMAVCRYFNNNFGLKCRLKWPNDIYIQAASPVENANNNPSDHIQHEKLLKVGGILVTSTFENGRFKVLIGSGINISNEKPSTCLQQFTNVKLENEIALAGIVRVFELLYEEIVIGDSNDPFGPFRSEYYSYWLHTNQVVNIKNDSGMENAVIRGLDPSGYLKARLESGEIALLQPDGNSFDMLKGLITVKL